MTTAADLLALALRVEREEPSAALSIAVLKACGWVQAHKAYNPWRHPIHGWRDSAPDPLHSLDAVASLVPSGWWLEELRSLPDGRVYAFLADKEGGTESTAPTEPRARTAAALRARAQEARDEG